MKVFKLPDLGEGLAEAEIREWYVKTGDQVTVDQPLVSMETAKAVVDVPSPYSGKIEELHGNVNDVIKTGSPLITFFSDEVSPAKSVDKGSVVGALEESSKKWEEDPILIGKAAETTQRIKAMPAARLLAKEFNIDLSKVKASGPNQLITVDDVKQLAGNKTSMAKAQFEGEALHGVRRIMANVMAQSHQAVAPSTIIEDADISNLSADCDFTVLLLKAMVAASQKEPALNAWFDGKALASKTLNDVNIGLAVDTKEGLFVPVIKKANEKSDLELREIINRFKDQVKTRSIAQNDLQGASITLSNFGSIAGRYATPIVVPPMVAILGCGRSREAALVKNGKLVAGKIVPLSLTFDHRAATGGEATRFLGAVIDYLQAV